MNVRTKPVRDLILTTACGLTILTASPAAASGMSKSKAIIEKTIENYVADINKGDVKGIVTACVRARSRRIGVTTPRPHGLVWQWPDFPGRLDFLIYGSRHTLPLPHGRRQRTDPHYLLEARSDAFP